MNNDILLAYIVGVDDSGMLCRINRQFDLGRESPTSHPYCSCNSNSRTNRGSGHSYRGGNSNSSTYSNFPPT